QRKWGGKLGRTLVDLGFVDEPSMVLALSQQLKLPSIDLDAAALPPEVSQLLRVDMAERYGVFPVAGNLAQKTLELATPDPTNFEALQEISFHTGLTIKPQVCSASAVDRAIRRYYYGDTSVSSKTATPQSLGVSEPTYDEEH